MSSYVLGFNEIDKTKLALVGGKGANLGNCPELQGLVYRRAFAFLLKPIKE